MDKLRVAVVDDHPVVRMGVRALLERENDIEVVGEYETAGTALSDFQAKAPDVVLVDVAIEERDDGLRLATAIKERRPQSAVLFLAGDDAPDIVMRAFRSGGSGYLTKGVASSKILAESVRAVHRGEPILPSSLTGPIVEALRTGKPVSDTTTGLASLSPREREVLTFVAEGADNLKIAANLGVSERTVKAHVTAILRKLGVENRTHAALLAWEAGIRRANVAS